MRVALVCPGPSASAPPTGFDAVVAVNFAAELVAADHWVFLDRAAFEQAKPLGTPVLWTGRNVWHQLKRAHPDVQQREWHDALMEDDRGVPNRGTRWRCFSGTAALVVCWAIGATQIVTFGVDMNGTRDFAGRDGGEHRSEKRWSDERRIWDATCADLAVRGIAVMSNGD